jgi:hypothetical protein
MIPYVHPRTLPRSAVYTVSVNGTPVDVLATDVADFVIAALVPADFPAVVEVTVPAGREPATATVRPLSRGLSAALDGRTLRLTLERPEKISLDLGPGAKPLYLFIQPPENAPPAPGTPGVITFPAGQITEIDCLTLEDGQTLYLPGGAVLRGRILVKGRRGIRLCGHGILDGSYHDRSKGESFQLCVLGECPGALVEDLTFVRPQSWMLVLAACDGAIVRNLKQIGEVISSDGIDVVGCRDVLIEDCFLHNNDDCVVIKSTVINARRSPAERIDARRDVQNVLVQRCTFANWTCGNAMEIGHELSTDEIRGIVFRDIDVLHVHGTGAVFSLHNYDRALVHDILFEDIRIEHCYDKLIDIRISRSRFSTDEARGHIRDVHLRRIAWHRTDYNPGYTVSFIGGWDAQHRVENVTVADFSINGQPVASLDELEIYTRHCVGLHHEAPA